MLKTLHEHFLVLYSSISPLSPSLAADHALKQEEEVYKKSSKLTYRNVMLCLPLSYAQLTVSGRHSMRRCNQTQTSTDFPVRFLCGNRR